MSIHLLDCTLRDGAYINNSDFGEPNIRGIITHLQDANVEIIECGWLKDSPHNKDSTYFHTPNDIIPYISDKQKKTTYVAMIDYNRYDDAVLPKYDGKSIDAIRVVFPYGKLSEGIEIGERIKLKGYKVYFQIANTLAYSDSELVYLVHRMNETRPEAISIVDTFGSMYEDDLLRIFTAVNNYLDKDIKIGFHAHNNQQLAFALSLTFIKLAEGQNRDSIVDSSLCGMGRGAGNTTTELITSFLNRKYEKKYDLDEIFDAIDMYMTKFQEKYTWGYSTAYFIAGLYQCHVNNIVYLQKNHRINSRDLSNIIASLTQTERRIYDYDLLEEMYIKNQNRVIDDSKAIQILKEKLSNKKVLLLVPGKTIVTQKKKIQDFIKTENPIVISINIIHTDYNCDFTFFINSVRYQYARDFHGKDFEKHKKILLSNITAKEKKDEFTINFNSVVKHGWKHFDNAVICILRLLDKLEISEVEIAGFDGYKNTYYDSYADSSLSVLNPDIDWDELNNEIKDMFCDFINTLKSNMRIRFITSSIFGECIKNNY